MQKLIIAIVSNEDSTAASRALTKGGFSVTRLATTGGFLLSGNTTMLVGTDADRVDEAIHIIGENSCKRNKMVSGNTSFNAGMYANVPVQVTVGGATIFAAFQAAGAIPLRSFRRCPSRSPRRWPPAG